MSTVAPKRASDAGAATAPTPAADAGIDLPFVSCDEDAGACPESPVLDIDSLCQTTCALLQDGTVKCWGPDYGRVSQDGFHVEVEFKSPERVPELRDVKAISTGCMNACALSRDGRVRCWGDSPLGNGDSHGSQRPVLVDVQEMIAIASGDGHHCGLQRDKRVTCWGRSSSGARGDGEFDGLQLFPTKPLQLTDVSRIAVGYQASYAWTADRTLYAWGSEGIPLGTSERGAWPQVPGKSVPTPAVELGEASQLALGYAHRCLLRPDDSVHCWGRNDEGQLGLGMLDALPPPLHVLPEPVSSLHDVKQLVAGYAHTCALVGTGDVLCWGQNWNGQLGDGTHTSRGTPTPVVGLHDARRLALGTDHSCALRADHTVVCWGSNEQKRLGAERDGDSVTPVIVPGL